MAFYCWLEGKVSPLESDLARSDLGGSEGILLRNKQIDDVSLLVGRGGGGSGEAAEAGGANGEGTEAAVF